MEYVFGASAAAALYRRAMIDDVAVDGDFFDPDFFAYREDADVAWRAQLLGWRCIYTPAAVAYHVRTVTPANRRSLPPVINMHSVKNRFLMRIKNATPGSVPPLLAAHDPAGSGGGGRVPCSGSPPPFPLSGAWPSAPGGLASAPADHEPPPCQ